MAERAARSLQRYVGARRLAALGIAAATIVGAVFLVQTLGGGAEPGRIIDPVRNERTQGLAVQAEVGQLRAKLRGARPRR